MDAASALRMHIVADAAVTALMGTRLYPVHLPQAPEFPAGTYQTVAGIAGYTNDGADGLTEGRVQIDLYAKDYDVLTACRKAVYDALNGWTGSAGSPPVTFQGVFWINDGTKSVPGLERAGPDLYRRTLEATIWFEED